MRPSSSTRHTLDGLFFRIAALNFLDPLGKVLGRYGLRPEDQLWLDPAHAAASGTFSEMQNPVLCLIIPCPVAGRTNLLALERGWKDVLAVGHEIASLPLWGWERWSVSQAPAPRTVPLPATDIGWSTEKKKMVLLLRARRHNP